MLDRWQGGSNMICILSLRTRAWTRPIPWLCPPALAYMLTCSFLLFPPCLQEGEESADNLTALNNQASLLYSQGKYEEAEEMYRKVRFG